MKRKPLGTSAARKCQLAAGPIHFRTTEEEGNRGDVVMNGPVGPAQVPLDVEPYDARSFVHLAGVKVKLDTLTDTGWPFVGAAPRNSHRLMCTCSES